MVLEQEFEKVAPTVNLYITIQFRPGGTFFLFIESSFANTVRVRELYL